MICVFVALPTSVTANDVNADKKKVYVTLGGESFGIKMYTDGVYILSTEAFTNECGESCCPAKEAGLECNDIIKSADGIKITTNNEFKEVIEASCGKAVKLTVLRNNTTINLDIIPQLSDKGEYKTGMWIKDSAAGLGTVSFYSEELGAFCGLGHGMCDEETQELIPISSGFANLANVTTVTKSSNGNVGTLNGYFSNCEIGSFNTNCELGIYGTLTLTELKDHSIELASKEEVRKGKAQIYTTVQGETPQFYDIEILIIKRNNETINMIVKVTDDRLINKTGGVVQGMSGSPIVQDDRLVGVLTHVVVNNVDYGYGIFAETMYEKMVDVC